MNANQFLELIKKSDQLEKSDFIQLMKVRENFPYFQIPHVLVARFDYLNNGNKDPWLLGAAAVTSPDRVWLKSFVEKPVPVEQSASTLADPLPEIPAAAGFLSQNPDQTEDENAKTSTQDPPKPKPRRRKPPKDDLIETIKRKEKKEILDSKKREQIDLIKAFSKKAIKMAAIKEIEANQNTENLAASSTLLNENLLSESFAKILISQGKKAMAAEIYEKLALKFPDKKAYFADLIENLKK